MSPEPAFHKYTLLSSATANTFPELQSTRFRSARCRKKHEVLCWTGPFPGHLSPSTEEDYNTLTVVISDLRGIENSVWQGRDVSARLPAGARRGFLAVEYFQSVLVAYGKRMGLGLETSTTLAVSFRWEKAATSPHLGRGDTNLHERQLLPSGAF